MKTLKVIVIDAPSGSWYEKLKGVGFDVKEEKEGGREYGMWIIADTPHNYTVIPSHFHKYILPSAIGFRQRDVALTFENNEQAIGVLRRDES